MDAPDPKAPLAVADADRVLRLRDAFDAHGFTATAVLERLGPSDAGVPRREVPRLLRLCPASEPFGALARLLVLGVPMDGADVRRVLGGAAADDARAVGLLADRPDGGWVGTFRAAPIDGRLVFQEAAWGPHRVPPEERVMAVSGSSRTAAQFALLGPVEAALDLGTGCGLLALQAAAQAGRAVATDCNPRALNLLAFTARYYRLQNVELRLGDLYAPVEGARFDRIVSNPPYVLAPPAEAGGATMAYMEAGRPLDGVSADVVRGMPRHLKPGGFGQALVNWACLKGQDSLDRVRGWLEGSGCDAWLLTFERLDPPRYAARWVPLDPESDYPRFARAHERWMAYYEREGIEAVDSGLVTLRRRDGPANWFAVDEAPPIVGPCGEAVLRGFAMRDYLARLPRDEELLGTAFRLAPDARRTSVFKPGPEGWSPTVSRLQLTAGPAFAADADAGSMELVGLCRGDRPLGALLSDLDRSKESALRLVRGLIELGILLPPGV